MSDETTPDYYNEFDIAIIGMAGRFPEAKNVDEFWQNIKNGVECITFFSDEQLIEAGIDAELLNNPNYVKARGIIANVDQFDARLFGMFPREAELLDPQQRLFLECAWEALENAGYDPDRYPGLIGAFGGVGMNSYLLSLLATRGGSVDPSEIYQYVIGNDKDFLTTRVSYKLNLRGPSFDVQTACSTSLVATYLACQNLINFQCDMALAGGVTLTLPQQQGYLYQEGMILSPDGHCRAFDASAAGTVGGNGVAIVVLKRLSDAIRDGDHVYAVIRGAACNNDGSNRVGFTAPGVEGQAEVIAMAQAVANVEPDTISYIETHGTGTTLGDPIEIAALTQVFRERTDKKQFCALGAVKASVGHLDTAAGVTGLIKTALALKERMIPPSVNFEQPNPRIDFQNSPFFVNTKLTEWKTTGTPRRAGVSSFGIGGTNVHVIMEEPPQIEPSSQSRNYQLITLSAKTETAVETMMTDLADFLKKNPEISLPDLAFTYHQGRKLLEHRRAILCQSSNELQDILDRRDPQRVLCGYHPADKGEQPAVFMFSGQGAQYPNMGKQLYETEATFRESVDYCVELLKPVMGIDLRDVLYPGEHKTAAFTLKQAREKLNQTEITQPALFVIEYALAKLWMEWGIQPQAMIGHSIGEYVAACLAGVLPLDDALRLVAARGKLMQSLPGGAMLSVPVDETAIQPFLNENLSLAAVNAPSLCVVSGTFEAIEQLEQHLTEKGMEFRRLHTSHAFHSPMMEPILKQFIEQVKQVKLNPPQLPYLSNISGSWITVEQATDPQYWANHLRQPVRFGDGIAELVSDPNRILLEVGPGNTLSTLARRLPGEAPGRIILSSMRHPKETMADVEFILNTLGRLWLAGAKIDWQGFYAHERRHRIPLPTYPFERRRFWFEEKQPARMGLGSKDDLSQKRPFDQWFYVPSWQRADLPGLIDIDGTKFRWLLFVDGQAVSSQIVNRLIQKGHEVTTVMMGQNYDQVNDHVYIINPASKDDYHSLVKSLQQNERLPQKIVHLWNVTHKKPDEDDPGWFDDVQELGFYSLLYLTQALAKANITDPIQLNVLSTDLLEVSGDENICPEKALLLGIAKVISQEYANINVRCIDVNGSSENQQLVGKLLAELADETTDFIVAYRGGHRWIQTFESAPIKSENSVPPRLRDQGVYLITGGLGRIGLTFAEYLAKKVQAKLVLTDVVELPQKRNWQKWLKKHKDDRFLASKIMKIKELEQLGAEVLVLKAEVADEKQMHSAIDQAIAKFGGLNGVIHAAGIVGQQSMKAVQEIDQNYCEQQFQAKVHGTKVLAKLLKGHDIDFCVLQSSLSAVLGGLGMAAYAAVNNFMDAFATKHSQAGTTPWISVNWEGWLFGDEKIQDSGIAADMVQLALTPEEGTRVLEQILTMNGFSQIAVATADLSARIDRWLKLEGIKHTEPAAEPKSGSLHPRPNLANPYVTPRHEMEQTIVDMWQELLGIEPIGIYDNFFELGGHSLLATQLVSRMRDTFKVELPLRELFESPTIATLSETIAKQRGEQQQADQDVAKLLEIVEQMSDDEAKALLEKKRVG